MLLNHKPDESDEQTFYVFSQYPKRVIILVNWYQEQSIAWKPYSGMNSWTRKTRVGYFYENSQRLLSLLNNYMYGLTSATNKRFLTNQGILSSQVIL